MSRCLREVASLHYLPYGKDTKKIYICQKDIFFISEAYTSPCASLSSAIPSSVMIEVHYHLTRFASLRIKKYCSLPNRYKNISNRYATLRFLFVCYGGCSALRFASLTWMLYGGITLTRVSMERSASLRSIYPLRCCRLLL